MEQQELSDIAGENVKHKTIELLEYTTGENLDDFECGNDFLPTWTAY